MLILWVHQSFLSLENLSSRNCIPIETHPKNTLWHYYCQASRIRIVNINIRTLTKKCNSGFPDDYRTVLRPLNSKTIYRWHNSAVTLISINQISGLATALITAGKVEVVGRWFWSLHFVVIEDDVGHNAVKQSEVIPVTVVLYSRMGVMESDTHKLQV